MNKIKLTINYKIANYIYNLFGLDTTIGIKHHFYTKVGAVAYPETKQLIFSLSLLKKDNFPRYLIWHEVGHLITSPSRHFCVENEVNAQIWAIKEAKRRGYHKLAKEFIDYVKGWGITASESHNIIYSIAKHKILRQLNEK